MFCKSLCQSFACALVLTSLFIPQVHSAEAFDVTRFERVLVASNLTQPMEIDVAKDGRIFLIEIGGTLKMIDPSDGKTTVVGKLQVTTAQENGLIGLALDPNFEQNGWIYLQYSPPNFSGQHLSRFDFRDNQLDLASEKLLFKYEEQRRECCHHAGSLEFGPDGCLYIGTGDNTNPFNDSEGYAPADQRSDREPWDAQRTSANTKSYNGKVLRIKPEPDGTYSIPDGNLFPKDGSVGHPEIYVMGCRNPWRISIDPKTGYLYWGDVGPDAGSDGPRGPRGYDEVNQARTAGFFGWPLFIGNNFPYYEVDFATKQIGTPHNPNKPMNRSKNNTGAVELPSAQPAFIYYPSGASEAFPAVETGGRTACAGPVYYFDESLKSSSKFPQAYDRTLFAFEWSRSWIMAVHLDEESNIKSMERFLPEVTFSRPIDLMFDSQGRLYVLEYGETWGINPDARLVRFDYERGNRAPTAIASAENNVGREPLTVKLMGSASSDKDQDRLSYRWTATRLVGDNRDSKVIANQADTSFTFNVPGAYTVELEVSDPAGRTHRTSLPVIVGNAKPKIDFISPKDGDFFSPGEPIEYEVVIHDLEDGTSDFDEAEEKDLKAIESTAPTRTLVEASMFASVEAANAVQTEAPGMALIRKSDCLNCHAVNRALVGPSFLEIANKYRKQPEQVDISIQRVLQGSTGVWGKVGMLPHPQHTPEQVRQMVEYVFSVSADSSNPSKQGLRGTIQTKKDANVVRLEAHYTDLGRETIPALTGSRSITLRNRLMQAESADEKSKTKELGSHQAGSNKFWELSNMKLT